MRKQATVAKVTRPQLMDVQPRKRLFQRLDALRRRHLVPWIAAPAGSGKTSLLVSYVEDREVPALWYRVDEGDRNPADLFYYLRLALQAFEGNRRAAMHLPSFSTKTDVAQFAPRYFEAAFARLPANAVLVLDDYHLAPEPSTWHAVVEKAFECIPAGMNIVVMSRRAPPASMSRALVHEHIVLLDRDELHLTERETAAFAHRRLGSNRIKPSAADLKRIHHQTGGWPAGVSLLLRRYDARDAHAPETESEVQSLFDYLASAVYSDLTEATQRVLLYTACLPSFTAAQAAELSGVERSRDELRALYRAGLFVNVEGAREEVFRLHHLFRAFLQFRAMREIPPEKRRATVQRAATMLRANGRDEDAFALHLEFGDLEDCAIITCERAPGLFSEGRATVIERWLAALPQDMVDRDGWLSYWQAMCAVTSAPVTSRAGFERALERFIRDRDGAGAYLAWAGAVHASTYELQSWRAIETWFARLAEIEDFCPGFPSAEVGSQVASSLLMGLTLAGADAETLEHWAGRAISLAENANDPVIRVMTMSVLVLNHALQGDSGRATALVAKLAEESRSSPAGLLAQVAARGATAALAWQRADFEVGLAAALEGASIMAGRPVPMWSSALLVFGANCAIGVGDLPKCQHFRKALGTIAESGAPLEVGAYHAVRCAELFEHGHLAEALEADRLAFEASRAVGFSYGQSANVLRVAYCAFELGDDLQAREALLDFRRLEEAHRNPFITFWGLLFEADRSRVTGHRDDAIESLRKAFRIGSERQVYSAYCPTKERVAELCRLALIEGIEVDYTRTMIQRRRLVVDPPPLDVPDWPWPVRVRALGPLAIILDDESPVPTGRNRMPLLMLLSLVAFGAGGRGVAIDRIASALWPDADGDVGIRSFDVTLSRLRRLLGSRGRDSIRLEKRRVFLDRSICWNDIDALDATMAAIEKSARQPNTLSAMDAVTYSDKMLALYRGPFGGTSGDLPPALEGFRDRVRLKVCAAIASLGRVLAANRDNDEEEALYARWLSVDDRLALRVPLVRCLAQRGQQRKARDLIAEWRTHDDAEELPDLTEAARLMRE